MPKMQRRYLLSLTVASLMFLQGCERINVANGVPVVHPTDCVNDWLELQAPLPACVVQWLDKTDRQQCLLAGKGSECL